MVTYEIKYSTHNFYNEQVNGGIFEFIVLPQTSDTQTLIDYKTSNSLHERVFSCKNYLGFDKILLSTKKSFKDFAFDVKAKVKVNRINNFKYTFLDIKSELELLKSHEFIIDNYKYLKNSDKTELSKSERSKIPKYNKLKNVFYYLWELKEYLAENIEFCTQSTNVDTSASDAIKLKRGVCQDYAHIFIGICRSQGIPARYVSGYLNQGKHYNGSAYMHAWAEAYVPQAGWIGFDCANNLVIDENYIKVSHGVDYRDCASINGVVSYVGEMRSEYGVYIKGNQ